MTIYPYVTDHAVEQWIKRGGPYGDGLVWRQIWLAYHHGVRLENHGLDRPDEVRYDPEVDMVIIRVGTEIKTVYRGKASKPSVRSAIEAVI